MHRGNRSLGGGVGVGDGEGQGHPGLEVLGFAKSHTKLLRDKEAEHMLSHTAGMAEDVYTLLDSVICLWIFILGKQIFGGRFMDKDLQM